MNIIHSNKKFLNCSSGRLSGKILNHMVQLPVRSYICLCFEKDVFHLIYSTGHQLLLQITPSPCSAICLILPMMILTGRQNSYHSITWM